MPVLHRQSKNDEMLKHSDQTGAAHFTARIQQCHGLQSNRNKLGA